MIADDVITAVHEPTDWVNSIVCNIKETPEGNKKIRLCLDPKDLNKNIGREHDHSCTIDEPHRSYVKRSSSPSSTLKGVIGM